MPILTATRVRLLALATCGLLALAPSARPQDPSGAGDEAPASERPAPTVVPTQVRDRLMARDYEGALEALDAVARVRPDDGDLWSYLRGVALAGAGRLEEAVQAWTELEERTPASTWVAKARFRRADALRSLRRYAEAERIYEEGARRLRSEERQAELADVYLAFADELSTPRATPEPGGNELDYERAYVLYRKVLDMAAPRGRKDRALYRSSVCLRALSRWDDAIRELEAYRARFDPAAAPPVQRAEVAAAADPARVFEARLLLGRSRLDAGRRSEARRTLEDLSTDVRAALSGAGPWSSVAREFDAATRARLTALSGEATYTVAATFQKGPAEGPLAVAALRRFRERYPAHPRAPRAAFEIADHYAGMERDEDALVAWDVFLALPPPGATGVGDADAEEAREEHARLARRALFRKGETLQRQQRFEAAIEAFTAYVAQHPDGTDWAAAQQRIVDAEYALGAAAAEDEDFATARSAWARFLERHPLDGRARELAFQLGDLDRREAERLLEEARDEAGDGAGDGADGEAARPAADALFRAAVERWLRAAEKYSDSEDSSRALYHVGLLRETRLDELDQAIEAYRLCVHGRWAGGAQARLELMTKPQLSVRTERTFRAGEPAVVEVRTRNLEELEVELYPLDLEAYFRKHLTHERIEELDLDLIAPDQTLAVAVSDYADYAPLEQQVTLPVTGPGVWAVAVTSGEKRSTTLVVVSDLELVVKSSRREALVFVEDMVREAPAEGVDVLVAVPGAGTGGGPAIHALRTDASGVVRLAFEALAEASDLRVLALREGHCASRGLELHGLQRSSGLVPRGYVYTDRSAYRPGQEVHWRAVIRDVADQGYTFEPGRRYTVEVLDSQGNPFHRRTVILSELGTLSGTIELDPLAPVGAYGIRCQAPNEPVHSGGFQVAEYRLQKVELDLEVERTVVYRGERVEVGVRAAYYYGEPVADSPLTYRLPDGRTETGRTDAEGRATFSFETRDFPAEGPLAFRVVLDEEEVQRSGTVYLALRGYGAALEIPAPVVLAGEALAVALETRAPDGSAVGRALGLSVLRRESARGGRWAEVLVQRHELATDPESGRAETTLVLEEGGSYVLRAEGQDRFGNPVLAEAAVFVSGEGDDTLVRFLPDRRRLQVGERAEMRLFNRAGSGLALLTFEGEEILAHRVVRLAEGDNAVALDVDHEHFPNFVVSVAMMRGSDLLTAALEFDVERELNVVVTPDREVYAPGDEARVKVEVTDQRGRPVEAELSLAVVDAALYEEFPDRTPEIRAFFEAGARRHAALRTASSCTFSYAGVTADIAAAVLDEEKRKKEDQQWDKRRSQVVESLAELQDSKRPRRAFAAEKAPTAGFFANDADEELAQRFNDVIGVGGGAGGQFGGRRGGRQRGYAEAGERPELETAYWSPSVVTGADGRAEVVFPLPGQSTRWRITCRGVGADTLLGQAETHVVSRASFFVELVTPALLTEGDRVRFVARVHDQAGLATEARLRLRVTAGADTWSYPATVALGERPVVEHVFPVTEALPATGALRVEVEAEVDVDGRPLATSTHREVVVAPFGVGFASSESGVLSGDRTLWLALPDGREYTARSLELSIGPSVDGLLLSEALGRDTAPRRLAARTRTHVQTANDLLGAASVLALLERTGRRENPDYARLLARAEGLVARLMATQQPDGGWCWTGRSGATQPAVSSRVLWALGRARQRGLAVPPGTVERGLAYLEAASRGLPSPSGDEVKAMLLFARSVHDRDDFAAANRLHRRRSSLSSAALAYTALALAEMDRGPMADEVAQRLEERHSAGGWPVADNVACNRSSVEMDALALLALERARPSSALLGPAVERLLERRPWPALARGLAVAAVATHHGETRPARERVVVDVSVGGRLVRTLDLPPQAAGETLAVPLGDLPDRRVRVDLAISGRGAPHYSAVLSGFSADVGAIEDEHFRILEHRYLAAPPLHRGRSIDTGFDVVRQVEKWSNLVRNLPRGRVARAEVDFKRAQEARGANADYLVLTVPLPGGARVLEGSVSGQLLSWEQRDGRLVVQIGQEGGAGGRIAYELLGAQPGSFRVRPAKLQSLHEPGRMALADATDLDVLDRGLPSPDPYRPTPDELYHLGRAQYDDGNAEGALELLDALWAEFEEELRPDPAKGAARVLLYLAIDRGDPADTVRYFEVLKEKDPELTIPFDEVLAVGAAYRDIEEFERALLIFRATIEETFGEDLQVAGTLEEQGDFARATDTLERLWRAYPDLASVRETNLALSDKLLSRAPTAADDASLRRAGRDRASLYLEGVLILSRFLAVYPEDPLAPEAGLNLVSAHLDLEDNATASELAGRMAELYTEPRYADAFRYTRAVAEWTLGNTDEAVGLLEGIANAVYTDDGGNRSVSENKDLALYILAQIHHARRAIDEAIEYYERIEELFSDAREALAGLREKSISLPEVTTAGAGEPVTLTVTYRNVRQAELLVYAVDLMTLTLRERNLSNVTAVNLAGIAPTIQRTEPLGTGRDLRPVEHEVALALSEPGAYLVIARGDELFTSGLVLVSEVELLVKEDQVSGRLRIQAVDRADGAFLPEVDVRVIGSQNESFVSGRTDQRGLFVADGVQGTATVIARKEDAHYAFHRGALALGATAAAAALRDRDASFGEPQQEAYFKNVRGLNLQNQAGRQERLEAQIERKRTGVQVKQVK